MSVREEENSLPLFKTCYFHHFLNLFNPVLGVHLIILIHICNVRCQHGKWFSSTTTNSDKQSMTKSCCYDSYNLNNMFDSDHEKNQTHFVGRVKVVVLLKIGITFFLYCLSISQLAINITKSFLCWISIRMNCGNETCPKKRFNCYKTCPLSFEICLD